jgi:hypothetical protein
MSDREKVNSSTGATRRTFLETAATAAVAGATTLTGGAALMGARALKRLHIGVVGGGFGSAFFWHEHPNCVVSAVSDLRADRRHKLGSIIDATTFTKSSIRCFRTPRSMPWRSGRTLPATRSTPLIA